MTTTTRRSRLCVVPAAKDIDQQLLAFGGTVDLDDYLSRERLSEHLHGNLLPNADAPATDDVARAIKALSDGMTSLRDGEALFTVRKEDVAALWTLRALCEGVR